MVRYTLPNHLYARNTMNTGYTIVRAALPRDEATRSACILEEQVKLVVLNDAGPMVDPKLLTSHALRRQLMDDPRKVWANNGNTRDPKLPKSTGIVNVYLNHELNSARSSYGVVGALQEWHDNERIVFGCLDRPMYKPNGSIDSGVSLPMTREGNTVSNSFLCLSSSLDRDKKRGGIFLLCNYELYADILAPIFQRSSRDIDSLLRDIGRYNDLVMRMRPGLPLMSWFDPDLQPGDLLTCQTPYYSQRNATNVPYSGLYITSRVATDDWYASRSCREIREGFERGLVGLLSPRGSLANQDEYSFLTNGKTRQWQSIIPSLTRNERLLYSIDRHPSGEDHLANIRGIPARSVSPAREE